MQGYSNYCRIVIYQKKKLLPYCYAIIYTVHYAWYNIINACKSSLSRPSQKLPTKEWTVGDFFFPKLMLSSPCAASKTNDRKLLANFSISHVHVVGRCLSPAFVVENIQPSGTFVLKKDMRCKFHTQQSSPDNEAQEISDDQLQRRFRYLRNYLQNPNVIEIDKYESGEEEDVVEIEEYESGEEEDVEIEESDQVKRKMKQRKNIFSECVICFISYIQSVPPNISPYPTKKKFWNYCSVCFGVKYFLV